MSYWGKSFHIGKDRSLFLFQKGGHDDKVNDLNWNKRTDLLYSCSDDRHITEWSVALQEVKWFVIFFKKKISV